VGFSKVGNVDEEGMNKDELILTLKNIETVTKELQSKYKKENRWWRKLFYRIKHRLTHHSSKEFWR